MLADHIDTLAAELEQRRLRLVQLPLIYLAFYRGFAAIYGAGTVVSRPEPRQQGGAK